MLLFGFLSLIFVVFLCVFAFYSFRFFFWCAWVRDVRVLGILTHPSVVGFFVYTRQVERKMVDCLVLGWSLLHVLLCGFAFP